MARGSLISVFEESDTEDKSWGLGEAELDEAVIALKYFILSTD